MAFPRSDPEVKAWMEEHPDAVSRIERLYILLRSLPLEELTELALELMIDVAKYREQFRDRLITDIVKTASEKALEIIEGQGILLSSKVDDQHAEVHL